MKKYYSSLNLIRILACFEIAFLCHYVILAGGWSDNQGFYNFVIKFTMSMPEMFFMISGFVSCLAYREKINGSNMTNTLGFKDFFIKRIQKIYPAMITSVLLLYFIQKANKASFGWYAILNQHPERNSLKALVLSLTGLSSGWISNRDELCTNGPTWYICILMICYIIFFVTCKISKVNDFLEKIIWILLVVLGIFLMCFNIRFPLLYETCGRGYLNFFLGVIVAYICSKLNQDHKKYLLTTGLVLFICFIIQLKLGLVISDIQYDFFQNLGLFLIFLSIDTLDKLGQLKPIEKISSISLEIYLFNFPALALYRFIIFTLGIDVNYSNILVWLIFVAINIGMAALFVFIKKIISKRVSKG